ncbi:hypothetical protein BCV72DRAFT_295822 [Rhizopus microsporus var. microsporus]|uniref:Reverse transcriptase domain-containing protein n=1 Tax=Rhizopus microsporus var. microsporus TaxID=86635 RepID=A0A1X0QVI7_RHIZD|nr:hypothetical protein BCV72DRAFT_295822 [Rhizopus microsporus var. microsporus]
MLRPLLRWARRKGIRISAYLDDLIVIIKTKGRTVQHTQLLSKLRELEFLIKESKSRLIPTQILDRLGFAVNTKNMTLSVPTSKCRCTRSEAQRLLNRGTCAVKTLAAFIGKAQAVTPAVFPAILKARNLLALKDQLLHQEKP